MSSESDRAKERKQSRTVKALADKLQAGWTMLAQICPQCNTPLVREKGGQRIYCVSCELWVVRESDINKQAHSNGNSEKQASSGHRHSAEKSIEELEAGLASLSAHDQFGRIRSELQAENDDETSHNATPAVKPARELTPSQIANQKRLEEYERSKRASKEDAVRAELAGDDDDEFVSDGGRAAMNPQQLNSHMKRMEDLSSKLGAKMLQGWTLLGDACPNDECNCPLMRAKGAKDMFCVNCESTIEKQGETLVIVKKGNKVPIGAAKSASTVAAAPTAPASALKSSFAHHSSSNSRQTRRQRFEEEDEDEQDVDQQDEDERLMEQDRNSYRFRARGPAAASSSVKELDEEGEGEMADVIDPFKFNDLPDDLSDSVLNAPPVSNAPRSRAPSRVDQFNAPSPGLLSRATSSDDVSAKLGEKMLQGYALLSQHCPRDGCNCPLVRKKDGPMMCVKCGSTVVDESEYDESVHGPADNLPSSGSKSPSSNSPSQRATVGKGSITPIKRLASPSMNEMRDDTAESKKQRANSLSADGSNSTGSSGLPSPNVTASRSRTWSMEDGESTIDPRLRSQAQLGGKSGRFSAPSRAPSFAVGPNPASLLGTRHTSSAALNAAAQMAFSNGRMLSPHYTATSNGKSSAPNSVEQSPSHASASTPPHTPAIPSLALPQQTTNNTPASVGKGFHYPHSRYPSVNLGSSVSMSGLAAGARGSLLQATSPSTAGVKFSLPASVSLPTPEFSNGAAPLNARSNVTSPASVSFVGISSSSPSLSSSSSSIYNGALDASERILMSKLAECSQQLSECVDTNLMRELAQTMRELVSTIQHLRKAYEA